MLFFSFGQEFKGRGPSSTYYLFKDYVTEELLVGSRSLVHVPFETSFFLLLCHSEFLTIFSVRDEEYI